MGTIHSWRVPSLFKVTDVVETTPNQTPVGLGHLSSLTVAENDVQGTVVGTFQAQDPDGDTLTYHLTGGSGDGNNTMFTMETNGTLRTAMEFDYESYRDIEHPCKSHGWEQFIRGGCLHGDCDKCE